MTAADPSVAKLAEMADSAYRLGMRFAAEAEREKDLTKAIDWYRLFDRCFFSYRVSIALQLRLERTRAEPREAASDREERLERDEEIEEIDRPERPERYDERDRDRETERASLPILLKTLEGVVADASALPRPEPAELPTLRELLAHARAASPPPAPGLRSRLTASAAPAPPPAPSPHRASNVGQVLAARRATGPPRR